LPLPKEFDPNDHIIQFRGKPYLECKYRIHWMRVEKPDWGIVTELVELSERIVGKGAAAKAVPFAMFKATIVNEQGQVVAVSHGTETAEDWGDYVEKSETKAIARALAAAGFGTIQSLEFEEGTDANGDVNIADAPGNVGAKVVKVAESKVAQPTTPSDTGDAKKCAECGDTIVGYKAANGDVVSAQQVIERSTNKFQKPLCKKCYSKNSNPAKP